jgi:hypothetical protein
MSIPPEKREWLCIIPDKPGMLEKRLEIRPYVFLYTLIDWCLVTGNSTD